MLSTVPNVFKLFIHSSSAKMHIKFISQLLLPLTLTLLCPLVFTSETEEGTDDFFGPGAFSSRRFFVEQFREEVKKERDEIRSRFSGGKNRGTLEFPKFPTFSHKIMDFPQLPSLGSSGKSKAGRDRNKVSAPLPEEQVSFAAEGLEAHNKYRAIHGVPNLSLNDHLTNSALRLAKLNAAEDDKSSSATVQHTQKIDRGENIYIIKGTPTISGEQPVENWYSEMKNYNWTAPGYQPKAAHFTAIIWKDTQTMGMAMAKSNKGTIFVVAYYRPRGNINRSAMFKHNVRPPVQQLQTDYMD